MKNIQVDQEELELLWPDREFVEYAQTIDRDDTLDSLIEISVIWAKKKVQQATELPHYYFNRKK